MKRLKLGALLLAVSMMMPLCACKEKAEKQTNPTSSSTSTKTSKKPTETESEPTTSETDPVVDPTVPSEVTDESEDPLVIYGYDKNFKKTVEGYLTDVEFEYVYIEPELYYVKLEEALKSDTKTPDLYMMDAAHLEDWTNSDRSLGIEQLGIQKSDLYDQFAYTWQVSVDSENSIKALGFELAPSVIIYNRALAEKTLGCYEPSDVAEKLSDWNRILDLAHDVNINSEGTIKLLADRKQIHDVYWAAHTEPWVENGTIAVGSDFEQYILLQESLFAESLTGEKVPYSKEWASDLNTDMVVFFFGSLQTAADVIGYVPGHEETNDKEPAETQPDASDPMAETTEEVVEITGWGIIPAPAPTYDGGTWLMAASTCDKKETAAHVLRVLTLSKDTLTDLAVNGHFVNSRSIMKQCADDPNFISDFLGGQNPYAILVPEAEKIQISDDPNTDRYADAEIERLLDAYLNGEIESIDELRQQFVVGMEELLGIAG